MHHYKRGIIEVQRARQDNFKKRALFYTSRLISNQAPKGNRAKWNYDIKEVYLIAVLEGFSLDATGEKEYLHDICLCNRDTGEIFHESLGYIYLELVKFVKTESELETDLDRWLYVLKNMSRMKKIPTYLRKPILRNCLISLNTVIYQRRRRPCTIQNKKPDGITIL